MVLRTMGLLPGHGNNACGYVCKAVTKNTMPKMPAPLGARQGVFVLLTPSVGRSSIRGLSGSTTLERHRRTDEEKSSRLTARQRAQKPG